MGNLGELGKRQKGEFEALCKEFRANNKIPADKFDMYNVKRGLRDEMFHVSISMFHEVLNSRRQETGGWSAGNGSCAWQPRLFRIVFSTFQSFMNVRILPNRSALSPPFPKEGQGWFVE